MPETYTYRPDILDALAGHGLCPRPATTPLTLRDAVRDLYRYEIKRLRTRLLAGHILKKDYAAHVIALRMRYPILSVPPDLWVETRQP
ncbi:MAG: hypothetical protein ABI818_01575 [Acidobacteriota bacterium]